MDITQPTPLLAGLSPQAFMREHWQKKPLLVRNSGIDYFTSDQQPLSVEALLAMAGQDGVQSRAVVQTKPKSKSANQLPGYELRHGPFCEANALPKRSLPNWSVLVQGVDTHDAPTHELLKQFRFLPDARLDDVMVSFATDGGGVGPHFDSYDVFLLQVRGQRHWRIGPQLDLSLREGLPLKILRNFEPAEEFTLNPGDMLYLPPRWAHDGVAIGECMTYSIGFRAPSKGELLRELLHRMIDQLDDEDNEAQAKRMAHLYTDEDQLATKAPGRVPEGLQSFATNLIASEVMNTATSGFFGAKNIACTLGEWLSEPSRSESFEEGKEGAGKGASRWPCELVLHASSRMLYDDHHVFLNGQSWRAAGADAKLMRSLADGRGLSRIDVAGASVGAKALLKEWLGEGWLCAGGVLK